MGEFVRVEVAERIATIRLDRPKMNALNAQVQDEIAVAASQVAGDDDIRAVILYGGERVFAAGADIKEMASLSAPAMNERAAGLQAALNLVAAIPNQSSRRSPATRWAAAWSWRCAPTSACWGRRPR